MKKKIEKLALVAVFIVVSACSQSLKNKLGWHKDSPDEFSVVSNAPLVVPPEFTLRPPVPGAQGPADRDIAQEARSILLETNVTSKPYAGSKAESAFLSKAGADDANPQIKELLIQESIDAKKAERKKGLLSKVSFFAKSDEAQDPAVNAVKEKSRLATGVKDGKPIDNNDKPVIAKDGKGVILNHVFGF